MKRKKSFLFKTKVAMVMAKNRFQSFVPIIKQKKSMLKKKDKFLFSDIIQYDVRIRNTNFLRE